MPDETDAEVWKRAHQAQWTNLTDDAACLATCMYGINRTLVRIAVELERANDIALRANDIALGRD